MKVNQTMLTAWPIISARTPPPRLPNRAPYLQARALIQIGWGRQVLIWNPGFSVSDLNSGMGTNLDLMLCWHKSEDVRGHYEKLDMKPFIPLWQHLRPWTKVSEAMNFLSILFIAKSRWLINPFMQTFSVVKFLRSIYFITSKYSYMFFLI